MHGVGSDETKRQLRTNLDELLPAHSHGAPALKHVIETHAKDNGDRDVTEIYPLCLMAKKSFEEAHGSGNSPDTVVRDSP